MTGTRVLLLRHAETSAPDRFHGAESDIGLGERGRSQALEVARQLAEERPDALYCSAMRRAVETAEPIGRASGLTPRIEPDLHERKMGPVSGMSREDGLVYYEEAKRRWTAGDLDHTHEGGESFAAIRDRVRPVWDRITAASVDKTAVVVAHGVVIRVLLTTLLDDLSPADFGRVAIDNVAINDLRRDGDRWIAVTLNRIVRTDLDRFAW